MLHISSQTHIVKHVINSIKYSQFNVISNNIRKLK